MKENHKSVSHLLTLRMIFAIQGYGHQRPGNCQRNRCCFLQQWPANIRALKRSHPDAGTSTFYLLHGTLLISPSNTKWQVLSVDSNAGLSLRARHAVRMSACLPTETTSDIQVMSAVTDSQRPHYFFLVPVHWIINVYS